MIVMVIYKKYAAPKFVDSKFIVVWSDVKGALDAGSIPATSTREYSGPYFVVGVSWIRQGDY